jgi:RND family efflux transporter MFP subunit
MMQTTKMIAAVLVVVAILAAAGYAFRSSLVHVPVVGGLFAGSSSEDDVLYWTCPMHPHIQEPGAGACPECGMDLVPVTRADLAIEAAAEADRSHGDHEQDPAETAGATAPEAEPGASPRAEVTLDLRRQQLIGVRTAAAERTALTGSIRTVGHVAYDETRLADVNLKVEGWIEQLHADYTGRFIRKGEPLFTLYSPELLTTQQEFLLALKSRDQMRQSQIADAREYAERLVESSRQRLALWDLPADQIRALEETRTPQPHVLFRSPATGYIVEKRAVQGMRVMPGESLYRIADVAVVWVEADFYESEMALLRTGQRAAIRVDAHPGEAFTGRAVYIYPYLDDRTRSVRVRFELPNRQGRLKPGMYANVELQVPAGAGVTVPADAVIDSGTRQLVFVSLGDGRYDPRPVKAGRRFDGRVQILDGLEEGELVAANATFFIDSESQLRASLQGFEPPAALDVGPAAERLEVAFRSQPDPPRTGENTLEATVRNPDGTPVIDAEVSVVFYMAPMPTMNMPAMRTDTRLLHTQNGVYRGRGQVLMGGRWDVTVTVTRDGERMASRQFAVVAR